ncbi:MAG TPA: hypothetical protein VFB34_13155, partial [Chloroflexota bacterium]|nr:hypothetical protein [Chloroflexota bacterium]
QRFSPTLQTAMPEETHFHAPVAPRRRWRTRLRWWGRRHREGNRARTPAALGRLAITILGGS